MLAQRGMSNRDCASRSQVSRQGIINYQKGARPKGYGPTAENAWRIARALGVPVSWLISGKFEIDVKRLGETIEAVEAGLRLEGFTMEPDRRAALIAEVYEDVEWEPDIKIDRGKVLAFIHAAAQEWKGVRAGVRGRRGKAETDNSTDS